MFQIILITILCYSILTFLISAICDSHDVDHVLAFGPAGMLVLVLIYPLRLYMRNGFYECKFFKDDVEIAVVYTRGGEKPYQRLLMEYPVDIYVCQSEKVTFREYLSKNERNKK